MNQNKAESSETSITLTEEEKEAALKVALAQKEAKSKAEAYFAQLNKPVDPIYLNSHELLEYVIRRGEKEMGKWHSTNNPGGFRLDDSNRHVYELLSKYFAGEQAFASLGEGYSLDKGLLVFGNIGCGKTSCMRLFASNTEQSYLVISCRKVAQLFTENGFDGIKKLDSFLTTPNRQYYFNQDHLGVCFDDLGTEGESTKFVTLNTMEEVIQNRYDNKALPFSATHITTNLTAEEIEKAYGKRVSSRMSEMFNVISFPQDALDKRKSPSTKELT